MTELSESIAASVSFTDFIMDLVTRDLTDQAARRRSRDEEGPSIAWVIGHLAHNRHIMLEMLGQAQTNPFADRFGSKGASDGSDYPEISDLRASWTELSTRLLAALQDASDARLESRLPSDSPHGEKTLLEALRFHVWHEPYHMGQIGTLRTQFGLTPTSTLAMEASRQATS